MATANAAACQRPGAEQRLQKAVFGLLTEYRLRMHRHAAQALDRPRTLSGLKASSMNQRPL